ncbi:MAG: hypothetical protein M3088_01085, partial [Actinomycetota bacterium]|nr:hypothetical protein [Actinomycetota bacterium]
PTGGRASPRAVERAPRAVDRACERVCAPVRLAWLRWRVAAARLARAERSALVVPRCELVFRPRREAPPVALPLQPDPASGCLWPWSV